MAAQTLTRTVRLGFGVLAAAIIVGLVLVPVFGSGVEAKSKHRHGHGHAQVQQHLAKGGQIKAAAKKKSKKKSKKKGGGSLNPNRVAPINNLDSSLYRTYTLEADITCPTEADYVYGDPYDPQACGTPFGEMLAQRTSVRLEVISNPNHCSDLHFVVRWRTPAGERSWISDRLAPSESTGVRDLGGDVEWFSVYAVGHTGGCNDGVLRSWSPIFSVTVPRQNAVLLP